MQPLVKIDFRDYTIMVTCFPFKNTLNKTYIIATIKEDDLIMGASNQDSCKPPTSSSTIKIEDIIKNVNKNDETILTTDLKGK